MNDATKTANTAVAAAVAAPKTRPGKSVAAKRKATSRPAPRQPVAKAAAAKAPVAAKSGKVTKVTKPAKTAPAKAAKTTKAKPPAAKTRAKLVRDSFTMPESDFGLIGALKARALKFGRPTKKSELLRAGLQVLAALGDAQLGAALEALVPLKPGRPKRV